MYEKFFGFHSRPFASTADATTYCPLPSHEDALALLECCVRDGEGMGVMLGPAGSGKTLLCRVLLDSIHSSHAAIWIASIHRGSVRSLLQAILFDLSIGYEGLDEQEMRLRLTQFLMERYGRRQHTLLVVDEAQNLSAEQIEELRLLTNLEGRQDRAAQVLLVGQAPLGERMDRPEMLAARERIAAVARLRPFNLEETIEYVRARVARAGAVADSIFTADALTEVHLRAGGIARRINQLCHRALLLAFADDNGMIDDSDVERAANQLQSESASDKKPNQIHHPQPAAASSLTRPADKPAGRPAVVEVGAGVVEPPARPRDAQAPPFKGNDHRPTVVELPSGVTIEDQGKRPTAAPAETSDRRAPVDIDHAGISRLRRLLMAS